jgi:hypothetical protein
MMLTGFLVSSNPMGMKFLMLPKLCSNQTLRFGEDLEMMPFVA